LGQANLSNSEVIERLREFGVPEHQISDLDDDQHSAQTLTGIENRAVSEIANTVELYTSSAVALSDVVCLIRDVLDGLHVDDMILLNLLMSQSRSAASIAEATWEEVAGADIIIDHKARTVQNGDDS